MVPYCREASIQPAPSAAPKALNFELQHLCLLEKVACSGRLSPRGKWMYGTRSKHTGFHRKYILCVPCSLGTLPTPCSKFSALLDLDALIYCPSAIATMFCFARQSITSLDTWITKPYNPTKPHTHNTLQLHSQNPIGKMMMTLSDLGLAS